MNFSFNSDLHNKKVLRRIICLNVHLLVILYGSSAQSVPRQSTITTETIIGNYPHINNISPFKLNTANSKQLNAHNLQQNKENKNKKDTTDESTFVPHEFSIDQEYFLTFTDLRWQPFPRWQIQNNTVKIIDSLIDFWNETAISYSKWVDDNDIQLQFVKRFERCGEIVAVKGDMAYRKETASNTIEDLLGLVHTKDHDRDMCSKSPEMPYILSADGFLVSESAKRVYEAYKLAVIEKLQFTHSLLAHSHTILKETYSNTRQSEQKFRRWARLEELLFENNYTLPFVQWFGDYTGCNFQNWRDHSQSVPLFTVAANVNCRFTFPLPNYQTYKDSLESKEEWDKEYINDIPWENKIPQLIWRGGLNTKMFKWDEGARGTRYQMLKYIHTALKKYPENVQDMFNVKLTYVAYGYVNITELGDVYPAMPMSNFSAYRAVLDVDGYSWSSRFGKLLCSRSVVLKIEPEEVDYFFLRYEQWTDNSNETQHNFPLALQPWKHYIPIKKDFTDLVEKTTYALSNDNSMHIQTIIKNANEWCQRNMIKDVVAQDVLDVLEEYVHILDDDTSNVVVSWREKWNTYYKDATLTQKPLRALRMKLI